MLWVMIAVAFGALLMLLSASLQRGRDSFYSGAGAACLVTLLFLSFEDAGLLGTAAAVIAAVVFGLAFAQTKSRTVRQ
jgi:hypothetical protein